MMAKINGGPTARPVPVGEIIRIMGSRPRQPFAMTAEVVSLATGFDRETLLSRHRNTAVSRARHILCYAMHVCHHWPKARIARHMHRDHSTTINSIVSVDLNPGEFCPYLDVVMTSLWRVENAQRCAPLRRSGQL